MDGSAPGETKSHTLTARALDEFRRFVVLFLYLWVLFGLFALQERIILRENGLNFTRQGIALVNALVLAKVMLVAVDLRLGRWPWRRPLILPIVLQALLFAILFIGFHVLEYMVIGLFRHEPTTASVPAIGGGGLAGLTCTATILFVALIPYFAFVNVSEALGGSRLKALLFSAGRGAPDQP